MRVLALVAFLINVVLGGLLAAAAVGGALERPQGIHPDAVAWVAAVATTCLLNVAVAGAFLRRGLGERRIRVVPIVVGATLGVAVLVAWVAVLGPWDAPRDADSIAGEVDATPGAGTEGPSEATVVAEGAVVQDLQGTTVEGRPWTLREEAGRVVVLTVWHSRSLAAAGLLGHLATGRERLGMEQRISLVSVCVDEDPEVARSILKHVDSGGPVISEPETEARRPIASALGVGGALPRTWILDGEGRVLRAGLVPGSVYSELLDVTRSDRWIGHDAPPIEARTLDGRPWSLADQEGSVVLLDFWATWCVPCIQEIPNLRRLHERHEARDDFVMVSVGLDERQAPLRGYLADEPMPWLHLFEPGAGFEHPAASAFEVRAIPQAWLIDREGRVVGLDLRGDELAAAVDSALN